MRAGYTLVLSFFRNYCVNRCNLSHIDILHLGNAKCIICHIALQQRLGRKEQYIHANAENIPAFDNCIDLYTLCYVMHELPQTATKTILEEAFRVLNPGGIFAVCDDNPESQTIQVLL